MLLLTKRKRNERRLGSILRRRRAAEGDVVDVVELVEHVLEFVELVVGELVVVDVVELVVVEASIER